MLFLKETQCINIISCFPARLYISEGRGIRRAYDHTSNSRAQYYPPLSSTSSSQSTMYLIMLLSVTLRCLFWRLLSVCGGDSSGRYTADKRLLFCKQSSDLLRRGLAPFQMGVFCVCPLAQTAAWPIFAEGGFNGIMVHSTPCRVVNCLRYAQNHLSVYTSVVL